MKRIPCAALLTLAASLAACGGSDSSKSGPTVAASATPVPGASTAILLPAPAGNGAPVNANAAAPSADSMCGIVNFQQEILFRLNEARAASRMCGSTFYKAVEPVTWNGRLADAAAVHAQDMAANNYFSHTSLDGRSFSQRISAAGYSWSAAGENIAAGQATPEQVMNAWLQSPAHCENIMNGSYLETGVACVKSDASGYRSYWVMELGKPK